MSFATLEIGHLAEEQRKRAYSEAVRRAGELGTDYLRGYTESFNANAGALRRTLAYFGMVPPEVRAYSLELDRRCCGCQS